MIDTFKLVLGKQSWNIRPMTLGQLRIAVPALQQMGAALQREDTAVAIDCAMKMLLVAISREDPEITLDKLMAIECSFSAMMAATTAIASASGLEPGEAAAVTRKRKAPASGSESMGSSPPRVDTAIQ